MGAYFCLQLPVEVEITDEEIEQEQEEEEEDEEKRTSLFRLLRHKGVATLDLSAKLYRNCPGTVQGTGYWPWPHGRRY